MRNRKQRREYERNIKHDKRASKCPICGRPSLFFTKAVLKPYEGEKEKFEKKISIQKSYVKIVEQLYIQEKK